MRFGNPESRIEKEPTKETQPVTIKKYKIMLQDYFEHTWVECCGHDQFEFDLEEEALAKRDELNLKEFGTTHPRDDHYGVIKMRPDGSGGPEILCPMVH